jgi:hypothetical protein
VGVSKAKHVNKREVAIAQAPPALPRSFQGVKKKWNVKSLPKSTMAIAADSLKRAPLLPPCLGEP